MSDWLDRRILVLCAVASFILVSACVFVCSTELRYIASGRAADATLLSAKEEYARKKEGSMPYPRLRVVYEFDDRGSTRTDTDFVPPDWPIAKGVPTIPIEYIPGAPDSRLKGNDHKGWLWGSAALLLLAALIGGLWWKYKDVQ